ACGSCRKKCKGSGKCINGRCKCY
uniref:Potassium channel toxin alpha-KTx 13.1 n=1 Tax=Tityus obscurus TaxID=1221240 RepID=KA131_TITOB|nr:RecName: Full=Potassium channel toxin alpha-KTx 13.1; AltName: Full=Toxin Tc1; AltName: Full=Toxin To1 [Tityus obscurus]1JLZ_A Chain A, Tityustoxin alpha-KTx [synthetic construct]